MHVLRAPHSSVERKAHAAQEHEHHRDDLDRCALEVRQARILRGNPSVDKIVLRRSRTREPSAARERLLSRVLSGKPCECVRKLALQIGFLQEWPRAARDRLIDRFARIAGRQ